MIVEDNTINLKNKIALLEEKNSVLEELVKILFEKIDGDPWVAPLIFGLTKTQNLIISSLYNSERLLNTAQLHERIYIKNIDSDYPSEGNVLVHICRIRKKIRKYGVDIISCGRLGYRISEEDKRAMDRMKLEENQIGDI